MSVTGNDCPAGLKQMRHAFRADPDSVTDGKATCRVCHRPNTRVYQEGALWFYRYHKESIKRGGFTASGKSYSKEREQW